MANSYILLILLFIFSPLPLSAQQKNDTEVNVLGGNTNQDGKVVEENAKKFLADTVEVFGDAPAKVILLRKLFTPPGNYKFRPFRVSEKIRHRIDEALRHRGDPKLKTWEFWVEEPKYVDFWFDPEDAIIFEEAQSVFESKVVTKKVIVDEKEKEIKEEDATHIKVEACFADSKTAAHFPLRCDGNLVSPSGKGGEPIEVHWAAEVTIGIDLDIDSDNTNGTFGGPDRDLEEDRWEAADKNYKGEKLPGKFVPLNDGDADSDQIPGFADFDESGAPDKKKNQFVKVILDISNTSEMIVWGDAKIRFKYSSSDPNEVNPKSLDGNDAKQYYTVGDGMIRIWTKDADKARKKANVDAGGDFIPGKKAQSEDGSSGEDNGYEFPARKLFDSTKDMEKTLYIEGIGKGTTSGIIKVEFSPKGDSTWTPDEVKVTVVGIDADVDSDNTAGNDTPERNEYEDAIEAAENKPELPGKIIPVNDGDFDQDGTVDYKDTEIPGANFTPLILEIPAPLEINKIALKISSTPSGSIKLWTKDAYESRKSGDIVAPGTYSGKNLERIMGGKGKTTTTLWMEGLQQKNCEIKFEVDPDGLKKNKDKNPTEYIHSDTVKVCPVKVDLVPDWNRDGVIDSQDKGKVTAENPWRFWINDDDDASADSEGTGGNDFSENVDENGDGYDFEVNGIRDLLDFFPLFVDIKDALKIFPPSGYIYYLRQADNALKGFDTGMTPLESGRYLTDLDETVKYKSRASLKIKNVRVDYHMNDFYLTEDFLGKIKDEGKGVILLEVVKNTSNPLVLEIVRKSDKKTVLTREFPLRISGVEEMFRHKNLRDVAVGGNHGGAKDRPHPGNSPETMNENKYLVWVHGYNNDGDQARATYSEIFKRLFWSGYKGKFYPVSWNGDPPAILHLAKHYHNATVNAYATADELAAFVNGLKGNVCVVGHSLGNMVVGSAINDHSMKCAKYFAVDAAVALEAYNGSEPKVDSQIAIGDDGATFLSSTSWTAFKDEPYNQLMASEWYRLFPSTDHRSELTWRNRFKNVGA
ncbi:MAG: hypothetical protein NT118_09040, partial [Lentisphaerae bacterium]|nr:hypothetical protein [Lentisphaerota bacterium]